jgi:SAM-dependent methyltransferase
VRIGEAVLRAFSRKPDTSDYNRDTERGVQGTELSLLQREFPQFTALVKGKRVVDFGCGAGRQSIALVMEGASYVCGIDTNARTLSKAKQLASEIGIQDSKLIFVERPSSEVIGTFEIVISKDSMEHFPDPIVALNEMKSLIRPGGQILITFGPPWFAPYGSHMHFFCKVPWLNILFSERTVMNVRELYRKDGANRYEEVESGLNKMTICKFETIISQSGLVTQYRKYSCIKNQHWMSRLPFLRELFVNHISCILTLPGTEALQPTAQSGA